MASKQFKRAEESFGDRASEQDPRDEVQQFQAKMKKVTGQLTDTASLWKRRKRVARMKTLVTAAASKAKA